MNDFELDTLKRWKTGTFVPYVAINSLTRYNKCLPKEEKNCRLAPSAGLISDDSNKEGFN